MTTLAFVLVVVALFCGVAIGWIGGTTRQQLRDAAKNLTRQDRYDLGREMVRRAREEGDVEG